MNIEYIAFLEMSYGISSKTRFLLTVGQQSALLIKVNETLKLTDDPVLNILFLFKKFL